MSSPSQNCASLISSTATSSVAGAVGSRTMTTEPFIGSVRASSTSKAPPSVARRIAGKVFDSRGSSANFTCSDFASRPRSRAMPMSVAVSGSPVSIEKRRRNCSALVSMPSRVAIAASAASALDLAPAVSAACRTVFVCMTQRSSAARGGRARSLDQAVLAQNGAQLCPGGNQRGRHETRLFALLVREPFLRQRQVLRQCAHRQLALQTPDGGPAVDPGRHFLALLLGEGRRQFRRDLRVDARQASDDLVLAFLGHGVVLGADDLHDLIALTKMHSGLPL